MIYREIEVKSCHLPDTNVAGGSVSEVEPMLNLPTLHLQKLKSSQTGALHRMIVPLVSSLVVIGLSFLQSSTNLGQCHQNIRD